MKYNLGTAEASPQSELPEAYIHLALQQARPPSDQVLKRYK